jgi:hypothetical protein
MKQILITVFALLAMNTGMQAQTWVGAISSDWNNPLNWLPNVVPNNVSVITILPSVNYPKLQSNVSVGGITTANGSIIDFNGFIFTLTGANGYHSITNATLMNSNASTDIILNLNLTNNGYNFQFNGNIVNDHITINLTGGDTYYEGNASVANTFNGSCTYNISGAQTVRLCDGTTTQYNGNFNFNRLSLGTSLLFTAAGNVGGNFNYQNAVGGDVSIGNAATMTNIQGTCTINASYPSINAFSLVRVKNQTTGGIINVQNSLAPTVQNDTLKVTNFTMQGFRGSGYTSFYNCKLDGTVTIADDASYGGGYNIDLRSNLITGNSTFSINGSNNFYESNSASTACIYNGNTIYTLNGSANLYLHQGDKSTYNGNLTISRNAAGYTRVFNAGAIINGNFSYTNNTSGDIDFGSVANATAISGTLNMNINLSPIGGLSMHHLVNQTAGGKINIKNTRGFDVLNDTLKVDSLNILYYRGSAYSNFNNNKLIGVLQLADSITYGGGYNTNLQKNTITGNSIFTMYGSNEFNESNSAQPNTFNGDVTYNINGSGSLYTSRDSKTSITGNLIISRTVGGYTRLFNNGATIGGNFSFTKNNAGASDLGTTASKTSIAGTINVNVTQTLGDAFSMHRIQNLINGGSISIQNTSAPSIQQDSLLVTAFTCNGYGPSGYANFFNNQLTGNLTIIDDASYSGGYNTNLQNNTINGNSVFTILGSNEFNESNSSLPNTFNGNVTYNINGTGSLYTSRDSKTTITGNLIVNRTVAGYTRLFNNGANIGGNFSFTKSNAGASDLGNLSAKTSIAGTINMNVTQTLGNNFSMHWIKNLTNGGAISILNTNPPSIQQDTLLVTSLSCIGYGTGGYAYFYNNQLTGNLTITDSASYGGGYNTNLQNNTINGNSVFTILGSNEFNESNSALPNNFNGNVTYNCNGTGSLYTSRDSKTIITGNLIINRTVAGYTRLFANGATIGGNFSFTKNNLGACDIGNLNVKTSIAGTINMNITQAIGYNFSMYWVKNLTNGGSISISNTNPPNIQQDSLLVTSFTYNGYGNGGYAYLFNNHLQGDFSWADDASYGGGYNTTFSNNTITGNSIITLNGTNTLDDGVSSNAGNSYLGNTTYIRNAGAINIGTGDTNSYAGNLTLNSATLINNGIIRFIGNTNTTIDQLGTQPLSIQYLVMNKTAASRLTLNKRVTVTSQANFVTGYINSSTTNPLIFLDNCIQFGTSDNSHVIGCVTKVGDDAFTFPLGNGIGYQSISITAPGSVSDSIRACLILKNPTDDGFNVSLKQASIIQIAPYHYWTLTPLIGGNNVSVSLGWSNPCVNAGITNLPGMIVAGWSGSLWNNLGNTGTTGTSAFGAVTQSGNNFGTTVFALGTTSNLNAWQITTASASASTICAGASSTLTAAGASTYNWQPGNLSGTSIVVTPSATTIYTITGTSSTGCVTTATKTVTVNPLPVANAGVDKTNTCTTPSNVIGTTAIGGNSYSWSPAAGLSASTIAQPTANPTATTNYTVTVTTTSTGCTTTDIAIVTVNKTVPTANAGVDVTNTCTTPSNTIGTATVVGNTYAWNLATGLSSTTIAQPTANPTATTNYTVTVTNTANGCTATDIVIVNVNKTAPNANAGIDKTVTCTTPSSIIGTASVAGNTYLWSPVTALSSSTIAQPSSTATTTTNYTVTVTTTANGCTASDIVMVTANKTAPTITTTATTSTICSGTFTTITASGANTYTWLPGVSLSGASITISPTTTTTYTVTGTNTANGCTNTATRVITVNNCSSTLNLKCFIQGYMNTTTTMRPCLFNQGVSTSSTITDTINVQLRNSTSPYTIVSSIKAILNTNGTAVCTFNPITTGSYYLVVNHRNSIQTWSLNPVSMTLGGTISYDFTTASNKAYGSNQTFIGTGIYAIFNSDMNQDGSVDNSDFSIWEADANGFASGYQVSDLDGNGAVDNTDFSVWEANANGFVSVTKP